MLLSVRSPESWKVSVCENDLGEESGRSGSKLDHINTEIRTNNKQTKINLKRKADEPEIYLIRRKSTKI